MAFDGGSWRAADADAILFDWDGIIADTKLDFSEIRKKFFGGRRAMILEEAADLAPDLRAEMMKALRDLEMRGARSSTIVPGARRVLEWVREKKMPWAVVSRNCRESILAAANSCGVDLPKIVRSRDDGDSVKPDPRALIETARSLGADPAHTLFIGDFIYDMMGARRAAMRGVLISAKVDEDHREWTELALPAMDAFADELESPIDRVPWEYARAAEIFGADAVVRLHDLAVAVPEDAHDIPSLVAEAAKFGVGCFCASGELTPAAWRESPTFPPTMMGRPLADAIELFLRERFPFARVERSASTGVKLPKDVRDVEVCLRKFLDR